MARLRRPEQPAAAAFAVIPPRIARFDPGDWPPTAADPDGITGDGGSGATAARQLAHRRWRKAQRRWAAEHGMTISELWRILAR